MPSAALIALPVKTHLRRPHPECVPDGCPKHRRAEQESGAVGLLRIAPEPFQLTRIQAGEQAQIGLVQARHPHQNYRVFEGLHRIVCTHNLRLA